MRFRERMTALRHRASIGVFRSISSHRSSRFVSAIAAAARKYLTAFEHSSGDARFNGENDLLDRLASSDRLTIIDCGANVGSWTRAARDRFPRSTIHAFEPVPETLQALLDATAGDALVVVHDYALSDASGTASIGVDDADPTTASLETSAAQLDRRSVEVRLIAGDDFAREHGIAAIHLLKIDAEGHDLAVLRGFSAMIGNGAIDVVQFEVSIWNARTRTWVGEFYDLLEPAGYIVGKLVPGGAELGAYDPTIEDFRATGNFAAVRSDKPDLVARVRGSADRR